jgi:hypothetical protein
MNLLKSQENCEMFVHQVVRELQWQDMHTILDYSFENSRTPRAVAIANLPILACVAAGGKATAAVPVAASWQLYLLAASVFDDLVDADKPQAIWSQWEHGRAINTGLGLILIAQACLARCEEANAATQTDIQKMVSEGLIVSMEGQACPPNPPNI